MSMDDLLQQGRLSQRCPACGIRALLESNGRSWAGAGLVIGFGGFLSGLAALVWVIVQGGP